jgi:hypothetical protein
MMVPDGGDPLPPGLTKAQAATLEDHLKRSAHPQPEVLLESARSHLEELQATCCVQFAVMRQYQQADHLDARGRRVPNTARKDASGTEVRDAMRQWDGTSPLTASWAIDNGLQRVTKTFYPPFTPVDREAGYEEAWRYFEERFGGSDSRKGNQ